MIHITFITQDIRFDTIIDECLEISYDTRTFMQYKIARSLAKHLC